MGAAAIPIIGMAIGVAGSLVKGSAEAKAAKANAAISRQDAQIALEDAAAQERQTRIETKRLISAQRAAAGASGSALSGSALLLMSDAAVEGELEAMGIRRRGELVAGRHLQQAAAFKSQARSAVIGGVLGAGASLFSGASAIAGGT